MTNPYPKTLAREFWSLFDYQPPNVTKQIIRSRANLNPDYAPWREAESEHSDDD